MQDDVILLSLDINIEESCLVRKGNMIIRCFDYLGKLWPLYVGKKYLVDLELEQLDYTTPEIIHKTDAKIEQVNRTFAHYLYGYVKNNVFTVGDFKFDFEEFNDSYQYEDKYIKFLADRINVTFLKELSDDS